MEQFHKVNVDDDKVGDSEIVWICYDTPVDSDGKPSAKTVIDNLDRIIPNTRENAIVLVSTQIPVGTCREIQYKYNRRVACSPENLRRGKAIGDFLNPERIVVGIDGHKLTYPQDKEHCGMTKVDELFSPLKKPIFWTGLEAAEMIKHALNSYLAVSIAFINEIAAVCDKVGVDPVDVAYGIQSDKRIGFLSYLKPGGPYTNDTLGREIHTLIELDNKFNLGLNLIPAIKKSNDAHRNNGK
jgi:UDPglucose 6-dehydrogenase